MKFIAQTLCLILCGAAVQFARAQSNFPTRTNKTTALPNNVRAAESARKAVSETAKIVAEIVEKSFPELRGAAISVETFDSSSDYFQSRFSFSRFLTFRRFRYVIFVNPQVFEKNAPIEGVRAIVAHELAHVAYYRRHNRFELFGLAGLQLQSFAVRFERGADLQAIKRGYGAGLKRYREWLYEHIPHEKIAVKKRDYFSPAEIDLMLDARQEKPGLIDYWIKNVPRNGQEIESSVKSFTK